MPSPYEPIPSEHTSTRWWVWGTARWAFLVFNVVIATGWIFWLLWPNGTSEWMAWVARCLVTVQMLIALISLATAYRRCVMEEDNPMILSEAWVYMAIAAFCSFVMTLPLL